MQGRERVGERVNLWGVWVSAISCCEGLHLVEDLGGGGEDLLSGEGLQDVLLFLVSVAHA